MTLMQSPLRSKMSWLRRASCLDMRILDGIDVELERAIEVLPQRRGY